MPVQFFGIHSDKPLPVLFEPVKIQKEIEEIVLQEEYDHNLLYALTGR
jgi:hypothetical protein